jgi:hypothetical protein
LISTLLLDMSAWARLWDDTVPVSRAAEIADDFEAGRLAVCLPFLLEAGFSARDVAEHRRLSEDLADLSTFPIDEKVERRAFEVQGQLARVGHHRLSPSDVLIAALADRHGLGVLHYDADFDLLLEKTDLDFHSEWLMPRGSL